MLYMLWSILGFTLMLGAMYTLYVPMPICYILFTASLPAFRVTPISLAAMTLEKYAAICHLLRHPDLCTPQRANAVFTLICTVLVILYAGELGLMASSFTNIFNLYIICRQENLLALPYQNALRSMMLILCYVSVAIVILFTYIEIMMVAQGVRSQSSSASKDRKTILLHSFQLLLCMASLLSIHKSHIAFIKK
ncbi:odorant receptor 131-2-like [Pyxicephalus adspersus]|uniref:odorant receptor 131-2-like n=1 Tax=Pyxicephalus adspersus TaxID=30357 RepID=UPI003B5BF1B5